MFTINVKSVAMFILISIAWYFGFLQLWFTLSNLSNEYGWLLVCIIFTTVVNEWFVHNILAHRRFTVDTSRWMYKVLVFFATIEGMGSPRRFVVLHRAHHKWADIPGQDFLYPPQHWFAGGIGSPVVWVYNNRVKFPNEKFYFEKERSKFLNILSDPWTQFCETYVVLLTILFWATLYFLAPIVLFKFIFMSRAVLAVMRLFLDVLGHYRLPGTYRNYKLRDNSSNYLLAHYLALGLNPSLLHNNHHGCPDGPKGFKSTSCRWFEVDIGYYGMRLLKPLLTPKK